MLISEIERVERPIFLAVYVRGAEVPLRRKSYMKWMTSETRLHAVHASLSRFVLDREVLG